MSHFNIDRTPPRVRAPDREAIRKLDEAIILREREKRRTRSLQTCHRPAFKAAPLPFRSNSNAYVPPLSARILNDPNLTDGARRCAAKLMELIYRKNRAGRGFQCTVLYLAKALNRSERAVQTYLAQLREQGYIRHEVIASEKARMCIGIFITLLRPIFPRHHQQEWPHHAMKSGVKKDSENYSPNILYRRTYRLTAEDWALRCMNGVFRAFMQDINTFAAAHP